VRPKGSLPCSKEPVTGSYSGTDESRPSQPHTVSLRSTLTLFSYLPLRLPSGLFQSCFPIKISHAFLTYPMRATCFIHLNFFDLITLKVSGEEQKFWKSWLCSLIHPPAPSSLLGPNILLSTLFSNNLNFPSSCNVMCHVTIQQYILVGLHRIYNNATKEQLMFIV